MPMIRGGACAGRGVAQNQLAFITCSAAIELQRRSSLSEIHVKRSTALHKQNKTPRTCTAQMEGDRKAIAGMRR
jgi:hypothetical protein